MVGFKFSGGCWWKELFNKNASTPFYISYKLFEHGMVAGWLAVIMGGFVGNAFLVYQHSVHLMDRTAAYSR